MKLGVVMGSFHKDEVTRMREEVQNVANENDVKIIAEIWVPGSVEKPLAMKKLLQRKDIDGLVVLGIIEKGGTKHGFTMGQSLMNVVMNLQMEFMKPIGLGVLGPGIEPDQIESRILPYARKATEATIHMYEQIQTI